MLWMALVGLGLVAGIVLITDDDDETAADTGGGSDSGGGTDTGGGSNIDPFIGDSSNDTIAGDDADNTILGKNGTDDLDGNLGDDRIFGDGGDDSVDGGAGNDSVYGGHGDDLVMGGEDDDLNRGGRDKDVLIDATGTDTLYGDAGADLIIASGTMDAAAQTAFEASPTPENGIGNLLDQLQIDFSADSDTEGDRVYGGIGDDTVVFGVNDTVSGGEGADTLVTASWLEGQEAATVTDFDPVEDQLVYAYDPADGEPVLTMELVEQEDGSTNAVVSANGQIVLRLQDQDESFDLAEHILLVNGVRAA
ncbi:calcium-binding protein [Pseudophaeobacter sp.]|uniref:calcium-binding protein n=1 Tax=Pseudophaeobacter sp. TaxID=1971739 RepID=UPI00405A375F